MKNMEVFNIRDAVDEIATLMEDKVKLKKIQLTTRYLGFDI